jgi:hypothetical protein
MHPCHCHFHLPRPPRVTQHFNYKWVSRRERPRQASCFSPPQHSSMELLSTHPTPPPHRPLFLAQHLMFMLMFTSRTNHASADRKAHMWVTNMHLPSDGWLSYTGPLLASQCTPESVSAQQHCHVLASELHHEDGVAVVVDVGGGARVRVPRCVAAAPLSRKPALRSLAMQDDGSR